MEQIVVAIIDLILAIIVLALFAWGFKYWLDKGGADKIVKNINEDMSARNRKLLKENRAYKQLIKNYQFLLEKRQEEVENLFLSVDDSENESQEGEEDDK